MLRRIATPAATCALAVIGLLGCNQARSDLRQKADQVRATVFNSNDLARVGQRVDPLFCKLDSAIIARPVGERVVDASLWASADEQWIAPELRQALEANGLRVGVVTGDLPSDVQETFQARPPQLETQWVHNALPDAQAMPIVMADPVNSVTLFLNHGGKVDGRDYQSAQGRLLVTPRQAGPHDVEVRIVPEIQHGEKRRTFGALEGTGQFAPQEFAIKDGQQEDLLRELAATVTLKPGQTLVVGCRPNQARTLGSFLFLHPEPKTDRILQSVLIIQASRNNDGSTPIQVVEEVENPMPLPSVTGGSASANGTNGLGVAPTLNKVVNPLHKVDDPR